MPQNKKPLLLISLFLVAFYASSTGYADKTFMPKQKTPEPVKTIESTWPNMPKEQPVAPVKVVEPMQSPALESEMKESETPNHPKRYER